MAFRQPLVDAMIAAAKSIDGALAPLDDIADRYVSAVSKAPYIITKNIDSGIETYEVISSKDITSSVRSRMMKSIKAELIRQVCMSPRHKNGFYGLAFAYPIIDFTESDEEKAPKRIPDLFNSFNSTDSFILLQILLKLFLRRMAIEIPEDIPPDMIMEHVEYARFHRSNSGEDGRRKISRWNPYSAPENERRNAINRSAQLKTLKKVFPDKSYNDSFYDKLLGNIWDFFIDSVLTDCGRGEYQLKYDRLLFSLKGAWHLCITCGTYAPYSLNGVCLHSDCPGELRYIKDDEFKVIRKNNHVYNRVFNKKPLPIKVKEHTAQLTNTAGRQYQDEFRDGDINVLSTSTTFELGIDIGRLKCVFLRNIPPTINSYIQRSGRAGRRLDGSSFVVTFARNSPHDQFYFQSPEKFMGSKLQPPIINMRNDKLMQRHVNSFLLGKFLLTHFSKIPSGHLTIKWFFGYSDNPSDDIDRQNSPYVQFRHWLESGMKMLRVDVLEFLPLESPLAKGHIYPLKNSLEEMERVRATADDEVKRYSRHYAELRGQVSGVQSSSIESIGKSLNVLERLDSQFKKQKLIDYLSSTSWLPSYAFPQDIVKLRVLQDKYADKMKLDRDREYGIAEYAPGASIIADGKLFESKGLVFFGQEPEVKQYRFCTDCRILYTHSEFEEKKECDSCGKRLTGRQYSGKYIEPLGFTTAFNDPVKAPDLHRQLPPPNTDIFLLEGTPEEQFKSSSDIKGVSYGFYSDGKLFKANRGYKAAGFQICKKCGILLNTGSRSHKTPWGSSCQGIKIHIHLAHEFTTEILQLRFTSAPERWDVGFWFSLSEVLKNSIAETLDVARRDIGVTFRGISESSGRGEIVIFDRVPGSAGYLQHVIRRLSDILKRARDTLKNCSCDIESSCYACLRSYDNQFHWEHLKRKTLIQWIEKLI